jgi:hypothetical protein
MSQRNRIKNNSDDQDSQISPELIALQRARNALRADATRVADTLRELVASDERFLEHSKKSSVEYDERLNAATKRMEKIQKREQLDNRILWWSFSIFFAVVAWIWKQRLLG